MEHQKWTNVCALFAATHLKCSPRKIRSKTLGGVARKRCRESDDTSLSNTRRRLMFNENDLGKVEFKVNFKSGRAEDIGKENVLLLGSEKNGEQYEQVVSLACSPPLLQENLKPAEQAGKSRVENDPSTPRRGVSIMLNEEKQEVVGPQTPSPANQKEVKGSLNSWIKQLRLHSKSRKSKNHLKNVAKKVENAQESLFCTEQARKCGVEKGVSTMRKGKDLTVKGVAGQQTSSPVKRKRAKGSLNSWIKRLRLDAKSRKPKNLLNSVAQKVENAQYYTRSLNDVVSELMREKVSSNQRSSDTKRQRKLIGNESLVSLKASGKKTKKIQQLGSKASNVETNAMKTWKLLLTTGKPPPNKDTIWPEVSFIHKVSFIQGPRVYVPWKGSVLDSVIGALLTQRVFDGTSSSAFMSLGVNFPQYPACDLYSRHHRILRQKRSNACSSKLIPSFNSTGKSSHKQESLSNKLGKQRRIALDETNKGTSPKGKVLKGKPTTDWKNLREICSRNGELEREADKIDSVDWHAVMRASVENIAEAISYRGMNKKLATRMKDILNRLASDHGNLDLEWLRNADPQEAKDFLLSIYGIGLKSAECIQLLSINQPAFPVDVNVARVTVRLGWVPAPKINDDIQMYLLNQYSILHSLIHRYLWLRLSEFDHDTLYQLHCHMITFGKVFCTKQKPNCGQCPMRSECKYFSNLVDSSSPSFQQKDIENLGDSRLVVTKTKPAMSVTESKRKKCKEKRKVKEAAIDVLPDVCIEAPKTPAKAPFPKCQSMALQENSSPKVRRPRRTKTRTEHFIYELHDWHPILEKFDDRDPDDPSPYLLVTWETDLGKPGETSANNSPSTSVVRGSQTVPGTIMIPCRTALKGNFPLNATYFQANEVFADMQTSQIPIDVPWRTLRGLPRKTLYCGTGLSVITRGRSAIEIRKLFHEGYICTRYFDRITYATSTLDGRIHKSSNTRRII